MIIENDEYKITHVEGETFFCVEYKKLAPDPQVFTFTHFDLESSPALEHVLREFNEERKAKEREDYYEKENALND